MIDPLAPAAGLFSRLVLAAWLAAAIWAVVAWVLLA
jgi:hypothetical protein